MMGVLGFGPARAVAAGVLMLLLTACATAPAPVSMGGLRDREGIIAPQPDPDFELGADARVSDPRARVQCVPYARQLSGIEIYGNANTWWAQAAGRYPRSALPASGSVMVVQGYAGPGRGHVSVVREIISSRVLRVDHANWLNNGEISVAVPVLDVSPNNDWSQIRVWHIPGGHWGGRVYHVQGFIHAFGLRGPHIA